MIAPPLGHQTLVLVIALSEFAQGSIRYVWLMFLEAIPGGQSMDMGHLIGYVFSKKI